LSWCPLTGGIEWGGKVLNLSQEETVSVAVEKPKQQLLPLLVVLFLISYGLLGLKLYFFYVPLMFVGYALIDTNADLERVLVFNIVPGLVIAVLGIIQSVIGLTFLNPTELAPELKALGNLTRESPLTHVSIPSPTSVFASSYGKAGTEP